jgi:hypothetical protein
VLKMTEQVRDQESARLHNRWVASR